MKKIDMETWERRQAYEHFSRLAWPFYSVTFDADVTAARAFAKAHGVSFYLVMVWLVTRAVNRVPAMLQTVIGGEVWQYDGRVPSFTDLHPGAEQFHIITMPTESTAEAFARKAKEVSGAQTCFLDMSKEGSDLLFISCLPWVRLTGLTNERSPDPDDCIPRIAWGRWEERGSRLILGLCVEVNHRTVDGVHIGRFAQALEEEIAGLEDH
ncbi:MAG: chloramphenicol acetyltransferase [Clostridia bacterium]|nr:chloramphenicol acetyltransferase [Clostridia bacterium]